MATVQQRASVGDTQRQGAAMRYALAIAALLALPVDASAVALIPKEMQGTWCSATGSPLTEEDVLRPEASIQGNARKLSSTVAASGGKD
jgi:hypothetical protein